MTVLACMLTKIARYDLDEFSPPSSLGPGLNSKPKIEAITFSSFIVSLDRLVYVILTLTMASTTLAEI